LIVLIGVEKEFLNFFYKRLGTNTTTSYASDFPFLSPCGRELNYLRCDDTPAVYTQLLPTNGPVPAGDPLDCPSAMPYELHYAGGMTVDFEPELLTMTATGRLYYPTAPTLAHMNKEMPLMLLASPLAVGLGRRMRFGSMTVLDWQGEAVEIAVTMDEEE
jgi:hypothetical protein